MLKELEDWLHNLPGTSVDILRLAGLVGPSRHPGRFFAGKSAPDGQHGVNLVHLRDVIAAIELLLQAPKGGRIYNICAPKHPARGVFIRRWPASLGFPSPYSLITRRTVAARLWMAAVFATNWGLSTSTPIRW